jgi:acyl-CoA thioester hydrolase
MSSALFSLKIKTRYNETDQMGYIHHGVYPAYLEAARIAYMNSRGISYKELEINGILLPVYEMKIKYLIPLTFDEEIDVRIIKEEIKGVRLIFSYEIYNSAGQKTTEAEVVLFFAGPDGKPIKPPVEFRQNGF